MDRITLFQRRLAAALAFLVVPTVGFQLAASAAPLSYFLPADIERDPGLVDPERFFGHEIGEWHLRSDQIASYVEGIAAESDRVELVEIGRTHEQRPLQLAVVSSPANLARLETIRREHAALSEPGAGRAPTEGDPVVVYLGYSIHGNEPSGSNAAPLILYHLASAEDAKTRELLDHAVILIDPCMNPDGLDRFAQWVNANRSVRANPDRRDREHREPWPGGRTNHYGSDLNRDWLTGQQPESRARIAVFQEWRPNVLGDFHEMGSDATFFFQPGVPSRRNPSTPEENVTLTDRIAAFHRAALDEIGSLYFSEEQFDDFYYGKGSTYPDVQGAIGILFEQASSRGHRQDTVHGPIDFAFTIRNQVRTSLSTLEGSFALRRELLDYQHRFYREAWEESEGAGWVVGDSDPQRVAEFVTVLLRHGIEVYELARPFVVGAERYEPGSAYLLPARQRQSRLLASMMEVRTSFADSIFYDVSAWTLPFAYGLSMAELGGLPGELRGARVGAGSIPTPPPLVQTQETPFAYAFSWEPYWAPRALRRLLEAGVRVRVSTRPLTVDTTGGPVALQQGAIFIPMGAQDQFGTGLTSRPADDGKPGFAATRALQSVLETVAEEDGIRMLAVESGAALDGVDLGSPRLRSLSLPRILMATGDGTSSYETGALWQLLDERFGLRVTRADRSSVPSILADYTHLILASGEYSAWSDEQTAAIREWVENGGVLIAVRSAVSWAQGREWIELESRTVEGSGSGSRPYATAEEHRGARALSGSIFLAEIDRTHPLAYGYTRPEIAVFRSARTFLSPSENPYETVVRLKTDPLLAGYLHPEQRTAVSGSASLVVRKMGSGALILFVDDPGFRVFWLGTHKLLLNALFFGSVVDSTPN